MPRPYFSNYITKKKIEVKMLMGIFCKNCNKELVESERPCLACGCVSRAYKMECETGKYRVIMGSLGWKHKRPGFKRPIAEGVNRNKISRDPKLNGQEVNEIYFVDRIKKWWRHIIRDASTGEIIHEDSNSLTDKNKK